MKEILYERIKLIPMDKGINYAEELTRIYNHYKDLEQVSLSNFKNLRWKITNEYPDKVILEITEDTKNTIKAA